MVSLAFIKSAQVVREPGVCEPVEGLEGSDPDDFRGGLENEHEGVSNLGLREDLGSLLMCLRPRQERVARGGHRSMPMLPLRMELGLHDLLTFQLDQELTSHQCRAGELKNQLSIRIRWEELN